jgi:hypothetical protein
MPKAFISPTYTFTPGASGVGTVNLSGISAFDVKRLVAVVNQTRGVVIYATGSTSTRYTAVSGSTLTLFADTTGQNSADVLQVIYEDPDSSLPTGAATSALQSAANASLVSADAKLDGLTSNGELVQAIAALRMAMASLTKSIGYALPNTQGFPIFEARQSVAGNLVISAQQNGTWNTATVTNQSQVGGFSANDQIPALMHLQADNLRRNIAVS